MKYYRLLIISIITTLALNLFALNTDSNIVRSNAAIDQNNYEKQLILIENAKLKSEVDIALQSSEQLNEQFNKIFNIYYFFLSILVLILSFTAFIGYVRYLKPLSKARKETERIQKESKDILNNIEGTLNSLFEEKYKEIEKYRFDIAIKSLSNSFNYKEVGIPIIHEYSFKGFSKYQKEQLLLFFKRPGIENRGHKKVVFEAVTYMISRLKEDEFIDDIFDSLINDINIEKATHPSNIRIFTNILFYYYTNNLPKYFSQIKTIFSLDKDNRPSFPHFIDNLFKHDEEIYKTLVDNEEFISSLDENEIISELVDICSLPKIHYKRSIMPTYDTKLKTKILEKIDENHTNSEPK